MAQEKKGRKKISILATSIIGASTLLLGGGVGSLITYFNTRLPLDEQKILQEYRILKNEWLFGNENEYLLDDAAAAILSGTNDPYTFYTKTSQEQNLNTSGYGFGISHRYIGGSTYIREVHDGPSKNKLLAGDIILGAKRNNESYTSFSSFNASQISSFLSDNKFNEYEFSILRGSETINVKVNKGNYSQNTVSLIQSPREENNYVMAVKVSTFLGNPSLHLKTLINNEYERVPKINKLIIDLRENGGGYVKQASQMAKLFVKKNQLIYSLVNKNNKEIEKEYQKDNPEFDISSYSLILDHNSASASELFALAMLAGTNCKSYGLTSYGKGIAQQFISFSDGSVMRYTYAYVYGPKKDSEEKICIHNKGIEVEKEYQTDYIYSYSFSDMQDVYYVDEKNQKNFLKTLNYLYPEKYPSSYSSNFVFTDAIRLFASENSIQGFNDNGTISKAVSDKYAYVTNDFYLDHYQRLLSEVLNEG